MLDGVVIDDTELFNDKLQEWEHFYNFHRPHGSLGGQTPYERLRQRPRRRRKPPSSVAQLAGGEQLGDLHGVEGRALAQVVAATRTARGRARPSGRAGCDRRSTGPRRRPGAASGCRRRRHPARRPGSPALARARAAARTPALIDSEWPVNTGTRTHVPDTGRSGMSRILRLSLRSFCSSSVSPEPSSTSEPASGSTLNAIGRANFCGAGNSTASPSKSGRRRRRPPCAPARRAPRRRPGRRPTPPGSCSPPGASARPRRAAASAPACRHGRRVRVGDDIHRHRN